jgi:hypothetical protein
MRLRSVASVLDFVAVAAICPALHAQAKPNFSGEWTMAPEKSDFGPMTPPAKMTRNFTTPDGPATAKIVLTKK